MAIISIPTSIGGINIPGGLLGGPLGSLYKVDGLDYVKYPRDLESSTRSHVVLFTISERKDVSLEQAVNAATQTYNDLKNTISNSTTQGTIESIKAGVGAIENAFKGGDFASVITGLGKKGNEIREKFTTIETTPKAYIALYMPETMQFSKSSEYDDNITLAQAAAALPAVGGIASMITAGLQNDAVKVALNKAGYTFNPNQQLLFQGISFREFQLSFTFTPYSRQEADAVNKIIKLFRSYAAPTIVSEGAGMFFKAPGVFDITFKFNGSENVNVPKFKTSVVKNVDVNYAPNGWATHEDGTPVQTTVTIDFQEMYLVDSKDINNGY